jgi:hypothetical protein
VEVFNRKAQKRMKIFNNIEIVDMDIKRGSKTINKAGTAGRSKWKSLFSTF